MEYLNHLLCEFSEEARRGLGRSATIVPLAPGDILQAQGEPATRVYFVEAGLVSLVRIQENGDRLEAGLVGREGMVGAAASPGPAFTEATVEVAGHAVRIEAKALQSLIEADAQVRDVLTRYQLFQLEEAQLNAACNASHPMDERLAKWVLRCIDRVEGLQLSLTQERIAEMLGVQRTTVTASLQRLAAKGVVRTGRGLIEVLDRKRLEGESCECYAHAAKRLPELGFPEAAEESACAA